MKTRTIGGYPFQEYQPEYFTPAKLIERSQAFLACMNKRRSIRDFSDKEVPRSVIEHIIMAASSAPSGAHKQPWTFCVISDPEVKHQIRIEAEKEEYESYHGRMNDEWLDALRPFQTDWYKPFLETAPYLIIVFKKIYDQLPDGSKSQNYYVNESVGLACGFLLTAIHHAGLAALVHTPNPMNFLAAILNRPVNERPFLLIPVGHPGESVYVPRLKRKDLAEVAAFY
jgi:iodotyrosine deiodinase